MESQVAALCSETTRPTVFTNLKGYEDFTLVDCLTRYRDTQALASALPSPAFSSWPRAATASRQTSSVGNALNRITLKNQLRLWR